MKIEALLVVLGCFCYNIVNGSIFIWGSISIYMASFFKLYNPSVTTSLLLIFSPIRGILLFPLLPLGSLVEIKIGKKNSLLIGIIIFLLLFIGCIFTTNYLIFVICFAGAFAINISFGYSMVQDATWEYFPKNKGLISGICNCGFIISSMISYLTHYLVNYQNEAPTIKEIRGNIIEYYYNKNIALNTQFMLICLFFIWTFFFLIAYFTIKYPSEEYKNEHNIEMLEVNEKVKIESNLDITLISIKVALTSKAFIIISLINSVAYFTDLQISLGYKQLGQKFQYSDFFLTSIGSVYPAISSLSRILFGYLGDKINIETVLSVGLCLQAFSFGFLPFLGSIRLLFGFLVFLYSISSAAHVILFNLLCIKVFGIQKAGYLINYLMISVAVGNLLVFLFNYYLLPFLGYELYFTVFMLFLLACSIGIYKFDFLKNSYGK